MQIKHLDHCGVEIVDIDIQSLSPADYAEINQLFLAHLVVVIRNQPVLTLPYARVVQSLGRIANWNQCVHNLHGDYIEPGAVVQDAFAYQHNDSDYPVQRVTGKRLNGQPSGIFGTGKLDWHCNMNGPDRARGVGLQGIVGVQGTSTSWMDTTKAYEAMSDELKARCAGVVGRFEYAPEIWAEGLEQWQYEYMLKNKDDYYVMPLVNLSETGRPGLYFHYHNKCTFPSDPELFDILKEHCFKPEFIYTHHWMPGDIVLSDQLITLHKRDQDDPAILSERILHRYTFHFREQK